MTVDQLREALADMPGHYPVAVASEDGGLDDAAQVRLEQLGPRHAAVIR